MIFYFLAGVLSTVTGICIWSLVRLLIDIRVTRRKTRRKKAEVRGDWPNDQKGEDALRCVERCRKRLRLNPNPNPAWVEPLVKEIPLLFKEVATVYYPDDPDPIYAPGMSEFARAVEFVAMDIADMLQDRRIGRLVDISARYPVRAWRIGRRVLDNSTFKKVKRWLTPVYKIAVPIWRIVKFKSPWTWASVAVSNVAIRTVQPVVVNIVASRVVDLYSGNLRKHR